MAFNRYVSAGIGTTPTTVRTATADTTVIGLSLANVVATDITVSVQMGGVYKIKNATVPVGTSLVIIGAEEKVVLKNTDTVVVTSNTASSVDAYLSVLE